MWSDNSRSRTTHREYRYHYDANAQTPEAMEARTLEVTVDEYFRLDAESQERLEYWYGRVVALAGEQRNHAVVKNNLMGAVEGQRPDCLTLQSGLRVYAPGYGRENYAYPDGLMVCGEEQYDQSKNPPVLLNPVLLVEVTSLSTGRIDLENKLDAYFQIESVLEYWVVDPDQVHVQRYAREDDAIVVHLYRALDEAVVSERLGLDVALKDIYRRVDA